MQMQDMFMIVGGDTRIFLEIRNYANTENLL